MILKQYYLGCLAHASYLIGDEESRIAAVVDPQRDVDQYLEEAQRRGFQIRYVFLTHFHADFLAGHLELRERAGARIHLGVRAQADYKFTPVKDDDTIEFGKVRLRILETPGHTPEAISILVYDLEKDERNPHAVLTGDTLFIGDVGRPDLADRGDPAQLYNSIFNRLLKLDEYLEVYPAHFSGSACGRFMSPKPVSTIGFEKRFNKALTVKSKNEFVKAVMEGLPDPPAKFIQIIKKNKGE